MASGLDPQPTTGVGGSPGRYTRWLSGALLLSIAWVAGILLIEDETAQTIFIVLLVAAVVGGDALLSRRRRGEREAGEDSVGVPAVPILLAAVAASFFGSGDPELAAVVPIAFVLMALWRLVRSRRQRAATARPL
ncbi:MAG: hypothetical protein M3131_09710 [Actinomycetota bacterium]|nr:hypothetical protein [Actinomycetota bacterium]